jgi:N-acylglucosamine 2-epimerase
MSFGDSQRATIDEQWTTDDDGERAMTAIELPDAGMNAARIQSLIATYRDGVLVDTLPFWIEHAVDREHGGFITSLNRDGAVIDTDKGVWQQGRFTWLLGELFNNVEPRDQWLELARHGIDFIEEHGFDPADGRLWFHLTRSGRPIRKRRYAFSESFAAIAYGELAKATGDDRYAEQARRTFRRFLDHNLNPQGVEPKFTDARPTQGLGFPMITIVTAQELRDSIGLTDANAWIDRSIETIRRDHLKPDLQCVMETVAPGGEIIDHFDGRTLNPGHAIEGAWFIMLEGKLRGDDELIRMGCTMLDWMWARGWDDEFGGLLYFVDVYGHPVQEYWHDMKFWWPHNEAIIATLLAWQLTGNPKYADWHRRVHDWSYQHFEDRQHGEWYGYLHRDGGVSVPLKGNLWKGPFHFPRMQLVCWQLLEEVVSQRAAAS